MDERASVSSGPTAGSVGGPAAHVALRADGGAPELRRPVEVGGAAPPVAAEPPADGIVAFDETGAISGVNPAAAELFGHAPEDVLGRSVEMLAPELRPARAVGRTREIAGRRRDGSAVPLELTVSEARLGDRRLFIGVVRDVRARRGAEGRLQATVVQRTDELAAANQRLRQEVERRTRAEAVLASEKRVLELIAAGAPLEAALEATCRALEERTPGARCAVRLAPDEEDPTGDVRTFGRAQFSSLPARFPPERGQRWGVADAAGEPRLRTWVRRSKLVALRAEPVLSSAGEALGAILVAHPEVHAPTDAEHETDAAAARLVGIVLEKVRADARARRQLAELAHVARLATMGEMASGLAHELNQPLCAIVNYAEACLGLLEAQRSSGELRQALTEVARQSERAGEVIRRLREFIRHRAPQRAAVDVNQAVREVLGLTSAELRQQEIRVRLQLGRRIPPVSADMIQIQQVLVNLVRNALDAMADVAPSRRRLLIRTRRRSDFIEIDVQDSGRGISAPAREQIFESFFTTKMQGLGMGLSISRSIVEMHDGRIRVISNPGGGATFQFTLPLARRRMRDDDDDGDRDGVRGG